MKTIIESPRIKLVQHGNSAKGMRRFPRILLGGALALALQSLSVHAASDEDVCQFVYKIYKTCYGEGIGGADTKCDAAAQRLMTADGIDGGVKLQLAAICRIACGEGVKDVGLPSYEAHKAKHCSGR